METKKASSHLSERDEEGLTELRRFIKEFLTKGKGSPKVREYLSSVIDDNVLLLIYLKGRKYSVKHAWETLKRKAEVRFDDYPEIFQEEIPAHVFELERAGKAGILKSRDNHGRRIGVWNAENWNPDEISLDQICAIAAYYLDKGLYDEECINNGFLVIINCVGLGLKHGRQFTLRAMLRFMYVFWYAYPIRLKGIYFINVATYLKYICNIITPFFTKKLKERFVFTTNDKQFEALHEKLPPKVLPKFLGGDHENEAAFDILHTYIYKIIAPFLSKKLKERFIYTTNNKKFDVLHEKLPPDVLPKFLGGVHENETSFDLDFHNLK